MLFAEGWIIHARFSFVSVKMRTILFYNLCYFLLDVS